MKTLFWAILLLCTTHCFSQNTTAAKDTLLWTDGTKYAGTVIRQDKHTGLLQFMTEDSQMHYVSASSIAQVKYVHPPVDDKLPTTQKASSNTPERYGKANDEPIDWSDPALPEKAVRRHNTGLGLTIAGTVLMGAGIGMIAGGASANGQRTTSTNAYGGTQTNVNVGAVGGIGILSLIVGLPLTIVGAVQLTKAKRMARQSMIHLR